MFQHHLKCNLRSEGEEAGMVVMGQDYQYISLKRTEGKLIVRVVRCLEANKGSEEEILIFGRSKELRNIFRGERGTGSIMQIQLQLLMA